MKRYIYSQNEPCEIIKTDVLIVGSGIAGLYAALNLPENLSVLLIAKVPAEESNSWLAQGGIASVIDPNDHFESHIEDTLKAGAGICDLEAVTTLVREGPENIQRLVELLVPFDKKEDGGLMITREGGHSCRRIVHCGGDATGRETTKRLFELAAQRENISLSYDSYLIDLLTEDEQVTGAIVSINGSAVIIHCPNIILATGGIGALYEHTTNPAGAVGDGICAASRAGAEIVNMEFVQFHPTTMIPQSGQHERRFLISEAVRGEGGILKNHLGEAFMKDKHPLADLAPRDIVTREIIKEMRRIGDDTVWLDVSSMDEDFFAKRFPTIFGECRKFGIKVPFDKIPVRPAQHYLMGGIKTDLNARTKLRGLYACGECACTGVHGGNRLASNSMLECLVFGRRAAKSIAESFVSPSSIDLELPKLDFSGIERSEAYFEQKRAELRSTMTLYANAVRTQKGMEKGKSFIDSLIAELDGSRLCSRAGYELYSMAVTAEHIFNDAIARTVSVGAHYIEPD